MEASSFRSHLAELHPAVQPTRSRRQLARHYTDTGIAREINNALRDGLQLSGELKHIADAVDEAFALVGTTQQDGTVWRFLRNTTLDYPEVGEFLPKQLAYTSTSLSHQYALALLQDSNSGDLWEVVIRAPSHALDVNLLFGSMQSHEDEILLPRGISFKLLAARARTDGKPGKIVKVEVWAKYRTTD